MFIHNECLVEAKDICSRASGNLKNLPNHTPLCFVISFEYCIFCIIVFIKGTFFLAIIWFCKIWLWICQVVSVTPEYPLLEFLFITLNNSKQIQNFCMGICWYIFWVFTLTIHNTVMTWHGTCDFQTKGLHFGTQTQRNILGCDRQTGLKVLVITVQD
jgi:hypothetical protein